MFYCSRNQFKKDGQVYEIVTYKIFVMLISSRKRVTKLFFLVNIVNV